MLHNAAVNHKSLTSKSSKHWQKRGESADSDGEVDCSFKDGHHWRKFFWYIFGSIIVDCIWVFLCDIHELKMIWETHQTYLIRIYEINQNSLPCRSCQSQRVAKGWDQEAPNLRFQWASSGRRKWFANIFPFDLVFVSFRCWFLSLINVDLGFFFFSKSSI